MSVSSTTSRIQYTLSSATQTVAVSFFFIEESHLWVTRTRGGVITTLILATHYTTTGQGSESGGAIIFNGAGTQVGDVITILRNVPITQLVDYAYNGRFPAETTERALDRLTMVSQMLAEKISRSVRFAEGETLDGSMQPGGRLGKVLSFDPVTGALQYLDPVSAVWESGVGLQVTSMAALALVSSSQVVPNQQVRVGGFYTNGDGGGGDFWYDADSMATLVPGMVVALADGVGRFKRLYSGAINVRWTGSKGDGATDDANSIQAAHDFALSVNEYIEFTEGTFLSSRITWKGVSMLGVSEVATVVKSMPGQDLFYVSDASIGESGSVATFPDHVMVSDMRIIMDVSATASFPTRKMWPVNGVRANSMTVTQGLYYTNSTGKVYFALQGGTTGLSEPTHTLGVATDGTVIWYFIANAQGTYGCAAFAFPMADGSVAQNVCSFINKAIFQRIRIEAASVVAGTVGFMIQRPTYACKWVDVIVRFLDNGFVCCAPSSSPNSYEWSTDTCYWEKVEIYCPTPFRWLGGYQCMVNGLNIYASSGSSYRGFDLLPFTITSGQGPAEWVVNGLYQETDSAATGRMGTIFGKGHIFNKAVLKTGPGSAYYDIVCSNSFITGADIANNGVNPFIYFYGNLNRIVGLRTDFQPSSLPDSAFIVDNGLGNDVQLADLSSLALTSERSLSVMQNRPSLGLRGTEWLTKGCATTPFHDMLIGWREVNGGNAFTNISDSSLETGGYGRRTTFTGFAAHASCSQGNRIGTRFPACKVRFYMKGRASENTNAYIVLNARTIDGGTNTLLNYINPMWTTSWQVFSFDVDLSPYSGRDLQIQVNNPSVEPLAWQDVAWVAVVPFSDEDLVIKNVYYTGCIDVSGSGSPEGSVTAPVGSTYRRSDGGAGSSFYIKESGSGNTGWVAK